MTSSQSNPSSGAFAFPALPMVSHRPETVVHPEGRVSEGSASTQTPHPTSSVWLRLFPQTLGSSDEDLAEAVPTPEGFELGHFILENRIGIGGMGAVFRALDTRLQRVVALKVLGPTQSRDDSSVKRFQNEASAAARLDHDNIARVYYIGEDHGLHFIAFEYITGTNLRDLIREQGRISPIDAVNYILQISGALQHTYLAKVVHRDIKPSNIIITPTGRAKLVDLGLARKQNSDSVADITLAGTTLGTFDYISPEQAKDPRTADIRSDIYSLGCTLYHALTGVPPYPEGTVLQKLLDHQGKEAPDPVELNRHIPPELSLICRKMMASDPKQRYATPEHIIRDLMPVANRLGLSSVPADGLIWRHISPPVPSFWERNRGWIASLSVLLLIVFVLWRFPSLGTRPGNTQAVTSPRNTRNFSGPNPASETPLVIPNNPKSPDDAEPPVFPIPPSVEPETHSDPNPNSNIKPPAGTKVANDDPKPAVSKPPTIAEALNPTEPLMPPFGLPSVLENPKDEPKENPSATNTVAVVPSKEGPGELPKENVPQPGEVVPQPTPPVVPMVETEIRPYWILHVDGSEEESKLTLEAACAAAGEGDTIEIRHNGRLPDAIKKPIRIKNKNLTIRGGETHRPLLVFSGVETPADGLITRLFQLSNAELDLINLDFHLAPKRGAESGETWSLAALEGSGRVLFRGVTATVAESGSNLPAIVELLPASASQMAKDMKMMNQENGAPPASFEVKVQESFLRGDCNVFVARHTLPGRIELEQSAIAVKGSLLLAEGNLDKPGDDEHVELQLEHTTCLVGSGLIHLNNGDTPRDLLPISVRNSRDNLILTNTTSPLILIEGRNELDAIKRLLRWDGKKNFYDGFEEFWAVSSSEVSSEDFPARMFETWVSGWKGSPKTKEEGALKGGFAWQGNWIRTEFADITAADLLLDHDSNNPAIAGATDRTDVGADLTRLPQLPLLVISEP